MNVKGKDALNAPVQGGRVWPRGPGTGSPGSQAGRVGRREAPLGDITSLIKIIKWTGLGVHSGTPHPDVLYTEVLFPQQEVTLGPYPVRILYLEQNALCHRILPCFLTVGGPCCFAKQSTAFTREMASELGCKSSQSVTSWAEKLD